MRRDQLAINTITTRHADLEEALAAYASAGFRQVEFHLPLIYDWLAAGDGTSLADVAALLARHGLKAIGGFELAFQAFSSIDDRAANHRQQRENARLLDALGGGTLVLGTDGPAQPSVEALGVLADELRTFADSIADLNVRLAIEFNWGPLVKSVASAVRVCEQIDRPNVGILFDPAHYHCTPSKLSDLDARAVRWISHVHVDDMRDKPGELSNCNSDRALPGEGILDLGEIFGRIEAHGYTGAFSIEMFNDDLWALPAAEAAALCYQSLLHLCVD